MIKRLVQTALFAACLCLLISAVSLGWHFSLLFVVCLITLLIGEWYFEKNWELSFLLGRYLGKIFSQGSSAKGDPWYWRGCCLPHLAIWRHAMKRIVEQDSAFYFTISLMYFFHIPNSDSLIVFHPNFLRSGAPFRRNMAWSRLNQLVQWETAILVFMERLATKWCLLFSGFGL